ncbi:MAG: VWA domain-containing protein [Planctomycetota bacterium]
MIPAGLFAWPEGMPLLLVAPLVWSELRAAERGRAASLGRLVGPRAQRLSAELDRGRRRLRQGLCGTALFFALCALMQPSWGQDLRRVEQRGVDIMVCLDVSRSMLARDLRPDRLARAKEEIQKLARRARGDRLGLVVFAGDARLLAPLTRDRKSFAELVELADPLSVQRGGTDLGAALETGLSVLEGQSGAHETLVLVSDGEDHEQRGLGAAGTCRERGIAVHTVGMGTALGSKITLRDGTGESFLRSRSGEEVVSAMDSRGLRRIAATSGGAFLDARSSRSPLLELYEQQILPMARKSFQAEQRREPTNRYQWPLLLAFVLFVLELCLSDRGRR